MNSLGAEVWLTLPYPPSANTYWKPSKGRGLVPSDEAKAYKARVAQVAALARVHPLAGPVHLVVTVFRPRRVGDLDNTLKVLNDSLNGVAWLDDDQVVRIEASRDDDASAPRVEVLARAERHATPEEAAAHATARAERARKARETRNRNRAAKKAATSAGGALPKSSGRGRTRGRAGVQALATPATYRRETKR